MIFYVGLHGPHMAAKVASPACISVNRLRNRKSGFTVGRWIMDSGAFTELASYGHYRTSVAAYAAEIRRWAGCGTLEAAVAQDWMCEPIMLARTWHDVREHQHLTTGRYRDLIEEDTGGVPIMPVLQGFEPAEYARHVRDYGALLAPGMWVGVGSVCKRQGDPEAIAAVLDAILAERPDLRLHGFGVKLTSLADPRVRRRLYSADSMAWSLSARMQGRDGNDWREAEAFARRIEREDTAASAQLTLLEAA